MNTQVIMFFRMNVNLFTWKDHFFTDNIRIYGSILYCIRMRRCPIIISVLSPR